METKEYAIESNYNYENAEIGTLKRMIVEAIEIGYEIMNEDAELTWVEVQFIQEQMADVFFDGLKNSAIGCRITNLQQNEMNMIIETAVVKSRADTFCYLKNKDHPSLGTIEIGSLLGANFEKLRSMKCCVDQIINFAKKMPESDIKILSLEFDEAFDQQD